MIIDADNETTQRRASQLSDALKASGVEERHDDEPIVVLIPKRHVETWIRVLLGNEVDEAADYTKPPYKSPSATEIKSAAAKLYEWTRPGIETPGSSPPSLTSSIREWRKIA